MAQPRMKRVENKREGIHMCFADWITRVIMTRLIATWGILLGSFFTIGGFGRISGSSFGTVARVPFAPASWGIPLAIVSLIVLIMALQPLTLDKRGRYERMTMQIGLYLMAVWSASFAVAFGIEIFKNPLAAVSGPFTYGLNAAICIILATSHRIWDVHAH